MDQRRLYWGWKRPSGLTLETTDVGAFKHRIVNEMLMYVCMYVRMYVCMYKYISIRKYLLVKIYLNFL
jgi:hypothetical protein